MGEHELTEKDIKIVSEDEAFWTDLKEKSEAEVENSKKILKFNEAVLDMANKKLEEIKNGC